MALTQKKRTDKLTGLEGTRVYPLARLTNSDLSFAQDAYSLAQLEGRSLPLVLKNLSEHLNDPASQGRPVALTPYQLLADIPLDKHGSIIDDPHGQIYGKIAGMVNAVLHSIEFAESVSGRWIMATENNVFIFFRVGMDFDTTIEELIEAGTVFAPKKKTK
jgi:hypothetical protein